MFLVAKIRAKVRPLVLKILTQNRFENVRASSLPCVADWVCETLEEGRVQAASWWHSRAGSKGEEALYTSGLHPSKVLRLGFCR